MKIKIKKQDQIEDKIKKIRFSFSIDGKPENYTRERFSRKINGFYNKKSVLMKKTKKEIIEKIKDKEEYNDLKRIIENNGFYEVNIKCIFSIPIQNTDSKFLKDIKRNGIIHPIQRPDLDNYIKYILDTLHGVFYDDDSRVVAINSSKIFSDIAKTDVEIEILFLEER